ncbi:MAG: colicin import membrane protein [Motiliproteus sp.]|jgi:colicin import membrane protein
MLNSGPKSYILPILLALLLHGGLVLLTATTWFENTSDSHRRVPQHIKAELVDLRSLNKANKDAKLEENALKRAVAKKNADAKARANAEARKAADAKADANKRAKQKQEQLNKAQARKKAAAAKLTAAANEKRAADKLALTKKKAALQQAELKRQADLKTQEQRQKQADLKQQQAESERQQQAERERLADEQTQRLEEQVNAEQAWAARAKELVASAEDVIKAGVQSQWRRPPSARNGMLVAVRIHLLPTGEVDDAYVVESSGDDAFDRSAVNAVLKAARFPELQAIDPLVFDRYLRQITLKFRPEDLRR